MSFVREYADLVARMGQPPDPPSDRDPVEVARTVLVGDGRRDEAAAAVSWWTGVSEAEAQAAVDAARCQNRWGETPLGG